MSRLEHDIAFVTLAELREKGSSDNGIKLKAGRKLDENRPALRTESGSLAQKALERRSRVEKPCLVGNRFRQFNCEAEILCHRGGPSLVSRKAMGPIEARVDFGGVEDRCVSLKVGTDIWKTSGVLARDVPAGAAQMDA